jgi:hypothetical protein
MYKKLLMKSHSIGAALVLTMAAGAAAQSRVVVPPGTVIVVRTNSALQSASAQVGQTFETTVDESIGIEDFTVIPRGSRIRGVITTARPATRQQSGVIEVVFDQLALSGGSTTPIRGKLTSTDTNERRQIDRDPNARVALVGGRGGIGAAIAGAGSGKGTNSLLSALGAMLSEGMDVNVPAGTALAVELEAPVTLGVRTRNRGGEAWTIYTTAERIRAAQQLLAQQGYYRGAINGQLDDATHRALFEYQIDKRLNATGNLDGRTARALGLNLNAGVSGATISADEASALRRDAQSLVARVRDELGASSIGRLNPSRAYSQGDLELWFAVAAFAENASIHEQIVRNGDNRDAAVLAGRALVGAARRVDTALQNARTTSQLQNLWAGVRRQMSAIENATPGT